MSTEALTLLRLILAEQHRLAGEIAALRGELAAGRTAVSTLRVDLGEHLRVISAVVGARLFSVNELLAHAALPEGEPLRRALETMAGALNGRRIGRILRTLEGRTIEGMRIERVGVDRLGVVWVLRI